MSSSHIGQTPRNSFAARSLPSRNVTDDINLSDCYADFILYCNPAIPSKTDTLDLKQLFKTPPKSDGKSFSIFILYQLICKLEQKEIKTWAELALELGVESPDPAKGQSPQKVQQYAVRLKRWMHAMHVDAFFEFLRGQNHVYWSQIPTQDDPVPEERDGVPNEEDLALRALLPETRPKRGRKRAEEKEADAGEISNAARRRRVDSHPMPEPPRESWNREPPEEHRASGMAATKMLEARLEAWAAGDADPLTREPHLHRASEPQISLAATPEYHSDRRLTHPVYRHPASNSGKSPNVDPFSPLAMESPESNEPTARPRRKTGTVVSSAWRSSSSIDGSKLRGRPPSNRNQSDGPYNTFPAISELRTPVAAPFVESPAMSSNGPSPRQEKWSSAMGNWSNPNMGSGGNVPLSHKLRLPLPIPDRPVNNGSPHYQQPTPPAFPVNTPSPKGYTPSTFGPPQWTPRPTIATTRQASIPTSYYNADGSVTDESPITNSSSAPSSRPQLEIQDDTNVDAIEITLMQCILGAEWVDSAGNPGPQADADEAMRLVRTMIGCQREQAADDSQFLTNLATIAGARLLNRKLRITRAGEDENKVYYQSLWKIQFGPTQGSIDMKCEVPKVEPERTDSMYGPSDMEDPEELERAGEKVDWKKKYAELHQHTLKEREKLRELKSAVINGVVQARERF